VFKLNIQVKNGRYKWVISEIKHNYKSQFMEDNGYNVSFEEKFSKDNDINANSRYIFNTFKQFMKNMEIEISKTDNW
jgi:hypothetical protein